MKSQSIVYLLNEIEHAYWLLDLGDEMHLIWDLWRSSLQECKGNGFLGEIGRGGHRFLGGSKKFRSRCGATAPNKIFLPQKARRA